MTFPQSFKLVKKLVADFKANENYYLSPKYQEREVRTDYINKFFIALGWDVTHEQQKNPYEQEVKEEKSVQVKSSKKRADYAFYLAPNFNDPKFVVEAKQPFQKLHNQDDYFQTIRYGWHKNIPFAILTDFEEFHILDCRFSPDINTALTRYYKKFHYSQYVDEEKFAEIYYLFSREAVENNSLEKEAEKLPKPARKSVQKGLFATEQFQAIDEAFLVEIDYMREKLAKVLKKNDFDLNSEELTEATQRIIDRLVFIRFLEDKLIEPEHYVHAFGDKGTAWSDFILLCKRLDAKYNGIVFRRHFIDNENFKGPIDSEFQNICQEICHLNSRFLFNEIPIHILGSIYERFLGKIVNATKKFVKVIDKPEVRKAGGVFYTPKYIVDYIVHNTVGKLIEGKTPSDISKLHFADIACGSGSFLISTFDCLLEYHKKYYQNHPKEADRDGCISKEGIKVLSIKQKQNILLKNIYGVDIDAQAVEVTQLSLFLKLLEDETTATANDMQVFFHQKILPDMSKNIVCGNSLIGSDILNNQNPLPFRDKVKKLTDDEENQKPLNFTTTFPQIMQLGGFDAIVGNPPYVDSEEMVKSNLFLRRYCARIYETAKGNWDMYCIFVEKSISILKNDGLFGYIIPNKFISSPYGFYLKLFCSKYIIKELVDYSSVPVFVSNGVRINVYPVLLIIQKNIKDKKGKYIKMIKDDIIRIDYIKNFVIKNGDTDWAQKFDILEDIILKLKKKSVPLYTHFFVESAATVSESYALKDIIIEDSSSIIDKFYFINTGTIDRYINLWSLKKTQYIKDCYIKPIVKSTKLKGISSLRYNQSISEKIILAGMVKELEAIYDNGEILAGKSTTIIMRKSKNYNLKFLLAIINSKLFTKIYIAINKHNAMAGGYINVSKNNIINLPFKEINFQRPNEKLLHDNIVKIVDQIIFAKKKLQNIKTDKDKDYYNRRCSELEIQIDNLVYELYGLTEEEIAIVEQRG